MTVYNVTCQVEHWTSAWGSCNTRYRTFSQSAGPQADAYEDYVTGEITEISGDNTPARTIIQEEVANNAVRVEASETALRDFRRLPFSGPFSLFAPASLFGIVRYIADNEFRNWTNFAFNGTNDGMRSGRLHCYGMLLEFQGGSGSLILGQDQQHIDSEHADIRYIDCDTDKGFNRDSDTEVTNQKFGTRLYRINSFVWEGGNFWGVKQEHAFYNSNLKGPYRVRNVDVYWCGRTAHQLVNRTQDADGIPGYGVIVMENVRARDNTMTTSGHQFSNRGNFTNKWYFWDCTSSILNDPGLHPNWIDRPTSGWQLSLGKPCPDNEPRNVVPYYEIDRFWSCARGHTTGGDSRSEIQLRSGARVLAIKRSFLADYDMSSTEQVLDLSFWDDVPFIYDCKSEDCLIDAGYESEAECQADENNVNPNFGEPLTEKVILDRQNVVIGKCRISFTPEHLQEWPDPNKTGQGYLDMLAFFDANPDPRIEIIDTSTDDGDDDTTRLSGSKFAEHNLSGIFTVKDEGGMFGQAKTIISVGAQARGRNGFQNNSFSIGPAGEDGKSSNNRHALFGDVTVTNTDGSIDFDGGTNADHELSGIFRVNFAGQIPGEQEGFIQQRHVAGGFFEIRGEGADSQFRNVLHDLLPVGLAWDRCPDTNRWRITRALSDTIQQVKSRAEELLPEMFPDTSSEQYPEWLVEMDLPRDCLNNVGDVLLRNYLVFLFRRHGSGGMSERKLLQVLQAAGFQNVTISYPREPVADCVDSDCLSGICDDAINYRFLVSSPDLIEFNADVCNADCLSPLYSVGNDDLECLVDAAKPAHTEPIYGLSSESRGWRDVFVWNDTESWDDDG